jgi:ABC-2 type transport system permease protein
MNFSRVWAVISKEMLEIRKNRTLIMTVLLPPLLLSLLPLGIMAAAGGAMSRNNLTPDDIARIVQGSPELAGFTAGEVVQVIILRQFLLMYLMMPLIVPITIATYSIIGEKEMRSLEPLLATPITTSELLVGKGISAVVPAILATWLAYAVFFIGTRLIVSSGHILEVLLNPMWVWAMLVLAPLLSLFAVSLGIIISSRVNDTRAAQQLAGLVVIPIVLLAVGQTTGFIFLSTVAFVVAAILIALIDVGVLYAGVQLFQRETILTRWK